MHTLLGLYMSVFVFVCTEPDISWFRLEYRWEWAVSFHFDWKYVSGKKTFRWPMVCTSTILLQCLVHIFSDLLFLEPILPLFGPNRNVTLGMCVLHPTNPDFIFQYHCFECHYVSRTTKSNQLRCNPFDAVPSEVNCQVLYTFNQVSLSPTFALHSLTEPHTSISASEMPR